MNQRPVIKGIILFIVGLIFSIIMYFPDILRFFEGTLYIGKGDGLKQMIPFQYYLYEHYKNGAMFYDVSFGLGGNYFKSLSYYYSTSPITVVSFIGLYLFEWIASHDVTILNMMFYQIFIAIFKCSLVFVSTYLLAKIYGMKRINATLTAVIFSWSTIFYYFTFTWSFYSDVMIYLPLSLLGVEWICRKRSIVPLTLAIALTLGSNFYLAYYEAIIVGFYFLYRIIFPIYKPDRLNVLIKTTIATLLGLMIGNIGFLVGVQSFLQNDREPTPFKLELFKFTTENDLFYNGFQLIIIFVGFISLCALPLYKHYYYRLFAIFTWISLLFSFSPYIDSMFNGFSMPQHRWIYTIALSMSVLIGLFMQHVKKLSIKQLLLASMPIVFIITGLAIYYNLYQWWTIFIPLIIASLALYIKYESKWIHIVTVLLIMSCQWCLISEYRTLSFKEYIPTKETLIDKSFYTHTMQREINQTKERQRDDLRRIELSEPVHPNTPMYYGYNGTKLYSSIFNKDIYKFYEQDLQIMMPKNGNSYYSGLSNRSNLYSLFNVDDYISPKQDAPHMFEKVKIFSAPDNVYYKYRNKLPLDSARVMTSVYDPSLLKTPLDREHAMLTGVIKETNHSSPFENAKLIDDYQISYRNTELKNGQINVLKDGGGITIHLKNKDITAYKELYLSVTSDIVTPKNKDFTIAANETIRHMVAKNYKYRRVTKPVIYTVKATNEINFKYEKGTYTFDLHHIQGEDYKTLENAYKKPSKLTFKKFNRKFEVGLKGDEGTLVIPMPYEKGLVALVDGVYRPVEQVNYFMTGVNVREQDEKVIIMYEQPNFRLQLLVMTLGILLLIGYEWIDRKRKKEYKK